MIWSWTPAIRSTKSAWVVAAVTRKKTCRIAAVPFSGPFQLSDALDLSIVAQSCWDRACVSGAKEFGKHRRLTLEQKEQCRRFPKLSVSQDLTQPHGKKVRVRQEYLVPSIIKTSYKRWYSCNNLIKLFTRVYRIVTRVLTLLTSLHYAWRKILLSDAYIFFRAGFSFKYDSQLFLTYN